MGEGPNENFIVRFGVYEVDLSSGELRKGGVRIKLQEQPYKVLIALLESPGQVVTREELRNRIWPKESFGDFDHALNVAVGKLRTALNDSADVPRFIETLHRRGYRFIGPVEPKGSSASATVVAQPAKSAAQMPRSVFALASLLLVLVLSGIVWRLVGSRKATPSVKQGILTARSVDNPLDNPVVSPDGKYVAYVDTKGLFLLNIETGEIRHLAAGWDVAVCGWFPDGETLLLEKCETGVCGLYSFSLMSGTRQKLLDGTVEASLSQDGSTIAYLFASPRKGELWLADSNGDNRRMIAQLDTGEAFLGVEWAPGNSQLLLLRRRVNGGLEEGILETRDRQGHLSATLLTDRRLQVRGTVGFCWVQDGRVLYSLFEGTPNHSSIWSLKVNPRTGFPEDKPTLLQDFPGFGVMGLSATANGKRLTYAIFRDAPTLYIAELKRGSTRLESIRPALTDYWDKAPTAWSSDSESLFFQSDRRGHSSFYRLSIANKAVEEVLSGPDSYTSLQFCPNRKCYLFWAERIQNSESLKRLLRQPVEGGALETVLTAKGGSEFACSSAENRCILKEPVLQEKGRLEYVLSEFDPMNGKVQEFTRLIAPTTDGGDFAVPTEGRAFDLSPDGKTIALVFNTNEVVFISMTNVSARHFTLPGTWHFQKIGWSADSKKVFVSSFGGEPGNSVFAFDLNGHATPLLQDELPWFYVSSLEASPDGRYVAWVQTAGETNVGMLENF